MLNKRKVISYTEDEILMLDDFLSIDMLPDRNRKGRNNHKMCEELSQEREANLEVNEAYLRRIALHKERMNLKQKKNPWWVWT